MILLRWIKPAVGSTLLGVAMIQVAGMFAMIHAGGMFVMPPVAVAPAPENTAGGRQQGEADQ